MENGINDKITHIVIRLKNGDKKAFNDLYALTYNKVYFFALKIVRKHEDALDVVQDTYLSIYKSIDKLKNPEMFNAWLSKIIYNKCMDFLRKDKSILLSEKEDLSASDMIETVEDTSSDFIPHEALNDAETRNMIMALIDKLPNAQRMTIMLHYYQGLNVEQIAAIMECPAATVKSRLIYARSQIKTGVEAYEKAGVKLYNIAIAPMILFIFEEFSKQNTLNPASAAKIFSTVSSGAHIAAVSASTTATGGTKIHLLNKLIASSLKTKIIAGVVATTITITAVAVPIMINSNKDEAVVQPQSIDINTTDTTENVVKLQSSWIYYGDDHLGYGGFILYRVHQDGTERTKLIEHGIYSLDIIGDWIYYIESGTHCLYKMNMDGTESTLLCDTEIYDPIFIDDWIYYTTGINSGFIYKIRTDGTQKTQLNEDDSSELIIDGDWIYYLRSDPVRSSLYKVRTDGTERTEIWHNHLNNFNVVGNWIYFSSLNYSGSGQILYKICNDGTGFAKVCTLFSGISDYYEVTILKIENNCVYFSVFISYHDSPIKSIYKVNIDGTGYIKLSEDNMDKIKIIDDWIYYVNVGDNNSLYKMRTDGTDRTKIDSDKCYYYVVSNDVIYYCNDTDNRYLYMIGTDGTDKTKLNSDVSTYIYVGN